MLSNMRIVLLSLGVAACLQPAVSLAGDQPIYVVNMQKLLNDSVMGKAARSNLEAELKKTEGQLEKMKSQVTSMQTALDKQASVLSKEALQNKSQELQKKQSEVMKSYQEQSLALNKKRNAELSKIVGEIQKIVQELAEEKGAEFVLDQDGRLVIYASKDLDLTGEVLELLDKQKVGM